MTIAKDLNPILIANRGEIACRVIESAQKMGYETIALFSEIDKGARHVMLADRAVCAGPAPAAESYLNIERVISAAKRSGARSIHPGYGFLSENADFANACEEAGIVFIGPPVHAIKIMGNKAASKKEMLSAGVPCIPGYQGSEQSDQALIEASQEVGYPLMVKAAAGGGGRGMRFVHDPQHLAESIQSARSESLNSFGSDELIIEKAVVEARHVEVQVFADGYGNTIHLFERDCSVQRRHQKVIEEAPSPAVTPEIREAMGKTAVNAAKSVKYIGAGTVEFLLDRNGSYYFLEMNTRLQVEHPVTEMITGLDLVEWQLRIAAGEALPLKQEDVLLVGHAMEVRLYAEDPSNQFLPASGKALLWNKPEGQGIRVDHGVLPNQEISSFYDPLIAKIIAHGTTREETRRRLSRALLDTQILGLPTNLEFLIQVLQHQQFRSGDFSTGFIDLNFPPEQLKSPKPGVDELAVMATLLTELRRRETEKSTIAHTQGGTRWSNRGSLKNSLTLKTGKTTQDITLRFNITTGIYSAIIESETVELLIHEMGDHFARIEVDGLLENVHFINVHPCRISVGWRGRTLDSEDILLSAKQIDSEENSGAVIAPMHGNILAVHVEAGQTVQKGDSLVILEAMKMEHNLVAEISGIVTQLSVKERQQVALNKLLMKIEHAEGTTHQNETN